MKYFTMAIIVGALVVTASLLPNQSWAGPVSVGIGIGVPAPVYTYPAPGYYPPAYYGPPAVYGPSIVVGPRYGYGYYGYGRWHPGHHYGNYGRHRR